MIWDGNLNFCKIVNKPFRLNFALASQSQPFYSRLSYSVFRFVFSHPYASLPFVGIDMIRPGSKRSASDAGIFARKREKDVKRDDAIALRSPETEDAREGKLKGQTVASSFNK